MGFLIEFPESLSEFAFALSGGGRESKEQQTRKQRSKSACLDFNRNERLQRLTGIQRNTYRIRRLPALRRPCWPIHNCSYWYKTLPSFLRLCFLAISLSYCFVRQVVVYHGMYSFAGFFSIYSTVEVDCYYFCYLSSEMQGRRILAIGTAFISGVVKRVYSTG